MKRALLFGIAVALFTEATSFAQAPRLMPVFSTSGESPAFMIECTNVSTTPARAIELATQTSIKVDGQELPGGGGGSVGGGTLEPGKIWKLLIVLSQGPGSSTADFGQRIGKTVSFPLVKGQHRVAVRCLGTWSEEIEFYWSGPSSSK